MSSADTSPETIAAAVADRIYSLPETGKRVLVAIAGPPASGKSTIAAALVAALNETKPSAALVPMDGFHLDNRVLGDRNLLDRKGAPETFDLSGFRTALERLISESEVVLPIFDRRLDIAVAGAKVVQEEHRICVVEGNYLLLDEPRWRDLDALWDLSVFVETKPAILQQRLEQRWLGHGMNADAARERALSNDIPNAQRVTGQQRPSDLVVRTHDA